MKFKDPKGKLPFHPCVVHVLKFKLNIFIEFSIYSLKIKQTCMCLCIKLFFGLSELFGSMHLRVDISSLLGEIKETSQVGKSGLEVYFLYPV